MIKWKNKNFISKRPEDFIYRKNTNIFSRIILKFTRWYRAFTVTKFITDSEIRLLDIGSGDGYFIRYINPYEGYGFDLEYGDTITDLEKFESCKFSHISMIAVIEHIENPEEIITTIYKLLDNNGIFIITTPIKKAEWIISLYASNIKNEHKVYYDFEKMNKLLNGCFEIIKYNRFLLGLNQLFICKKIS